MKKTIMIDLDGVLNEYRGDFDEKYIPPIKDGAFEFIKKLSKSYKLKIFTSRNLLLASKWVIENSLDIYIEDVTNIKSPNYIIIDDRCIKFSSDYNDLEHEIKSFSISYK